MAVEVVVTGAGSIQAPQYVHQGALTRAGVAHDGHVLVLMQVQRHAVESVNLFDSDLVDAFDIVQFDHHLRDWLAVAVTMA